MAKTAEEMRAQAIIALELTKRFTPEQRARLDNSTRTVEEFAGYILELTNADHDIEAYNERVLKNMEKLVAGSTPSDWELGWNCAVAASIQTIKQTK